MNECLLTRLKGVFTEDMPKLNELWIYSYPTSVSATSANSAITFYTNSAITISTTNGGYFGTAYSTIESEHLTSKELSAGSTTLYFKRNVSYVIKVSNKFALLRLSLGSNPSSEVSFGTDLDALKYCSILERIFFNYSKATGDISSIKELTSMTKFNVRFVEGVTGDIVNLGKLTNLEELSIGGTSISGSVEGFVSAQIANGRTTVTTSSAIITLGLLNTLSFGGVVGTQSGYGHLVWDSASKITVYYGDYVLANCSSVYAKGATAEEIAAWEAAGKTVFVVA